jgi:[acyl-carrier-protein] S-malonyltransferase
MGRNLLRSESANGLVAAVEERLHLPLARLMLEGPAQSLQATQHAQPAILLHSLLLYHALDRRGIRPRAVAGHSLGEFAGLVASGGLTPLDAMQAVAARGRAMAQAAPSGTGMAAVLGLPDQEVERVCSQLPDVVPANYNAPGQVVISGTDTALDSIRPLLESAGARRIVRLPVSAAFHSPLMADAAEEFAADWELCPLRPLQLPQVFNADAEVHDAPDEVRTLMVRQLTGPVRWTDSLIRLEALGVNTFLEVGPGKTLSGLVKKVLPRASVHSVDDLAAVETLSLTGVSGPSDG